MWWRGGGCVRKVLWAGVWGVSEAETPSQPSTVTRPNISLVLAGKAETRDVNITSLSPRVCQTMRPPPSPASHSVIRVQSCKIFATHVSIIWRIFGILNRLCGGGGSAVSWWRGEGGGPDQCSPLLLREIWHLSCHSWVWWTLLYLSQYLTTQLLAGASHRCLTFLHSSTLPPPHLVSLLQCHNHNIPHHHCLCQVWSNDIDPNDLHQTLYYTVSTTHWGLLSQYGWQQVNLINCWLN